MKFIPKCYPKKEYCTFRIEGLVISMLVWPFYRERGSNDDSSDVESVNQNLC